MFTACCFNPLPVSKFLPTDILCITIVLGIKLYPRLQTLTTQMFLEQQLVPVSRSLLNEYRACHILHIRLTISISAQDMVVEFATETAVATIGLAMVRSSSSLLLRFLPSVTTIWFGLVTVIQSGLANLIVEDPSFSNL